MWTPENRPKYDRSKLRYPSDLTDAQWALIGPFLDAWKARHPSVSGHQGRYPLREIVNAILYLVRSGCPWRQAAHLGGGLNVLQRGTPPFAR